MGKLNKIREVILSGSSDSNINFNSLCYLIKKFGFEERIKGDHHIFTQSGIEEIINVQPKGSKAKPYQVKQIRNLIIKYRMGELNVE